MAKTKTGLGDAAARRRRKLPTTAAAIRRAFERFPASYKRGDVERASFLEGDTTRTYRERILESSIQPGRAGRCVYFVTKAESTGAGVPRDARDKPFTVTRLCSGGKQLTGGRAYARRQDAELEAQQRAAHERSRA